MNKRIYAVSNKDRLFGYVWSEKSFPNESKYGQHYVDANKDPNLGCATRIRESMGVRKDLFDNDEIIIHGIFDKTEYAKKRNIFGKKFKVDDHIRKQIGFVKQGEVHSLPGDELLERITKHLDDSETNFRPIYKPRFFQEYVKELFLDTLKDNSKVKKDIALELAPRFGKTIWSIDIIQSLFQNYNYNICFIPSYVLTSIYSFKKELNTFDGYLNNMVLVEDINDLENTVNKYYGKKMIIVPVSLHINDYINKLKKVTELPLHEKVSFIDEADFGAHRLNSQNLIKYLDCGLNVYMTGTAIDRAIYPLENLSNVIRWSYIDMLMVKKGEHPIQQRIKNYQESISSVEDIVIPKFLRLSLGGVKDTFDSIPPEYRTDWNKLLSDVDKSKPVLSNLIKSLFGEYSGKIPYLVNLDTSEACEKDVSMIFANTPDRKQQRKFTKLVQDCLGPKYIVVLINGDETSNMQAETLAKKTIERVQREGKKVVFISKDMASRSFSVSEIDTVFLMFDRGLYATVSQKISRGLTPGLTFRGEKKENAHIISLSLDPNREDCSPIDDYFIYEAEKVQVNELSDGIHRVLRSINIFVNDDGVLQPIIPDEYATKLINSSSLIRVGIGTIKLENIINDTDLVKELTGVKVTNQSKDDEIEHIDSSTIVRTIEDNQNKDKKESKISEDEKSKLRQVLTNIVENIVEISEINNCESNNIIEVLNMIINKGYCDEVYFEIGVDCKTLKKIIESGVLSEKLLNTIITAYNKEENSISISI
jgi:hypothetical protein